ncbi:hypothetical protein ACFOQM_14150 [Paenibacillus sp. GCM10012307]
MTVGKTRLPWAPFHGERAAVKLHVALRAENGQPLSVTETISTRHDGPVCETLENLHFIMVMDRAYVQTGTIGSLQARRAILCRSTPR